MKAPGRLTPGREGREGVQPGPRAPLGWPFWPCPQPRPSPSSAPVFVEKISRAIFSIRCKYVI